jgi:hypothetical protein
MLRVSVANKAWFVFRLQMEKAALKYRTLLLIDVRPDEGSSMHIRNVCILRDCAVVVAVRSET